MLHSNYGRGEDLLQIFGVSRLFEKPRSNDTLHQEGISYKRCKVLTVFVSCGCRPVEAHTIAASDLSL
jgi:hypothetical protein